MTSFQSSTPRTSRGFTLMELMVVMAIIGVLIGIMIPASSQVTRMMRKVQAQRSATELRNAIGMYFTEYKRFPSLPSVQPGSDAELETDAGTGLISVLIPMPNNSMAEKLNRRQIAFFSDKIAKRPEQPGIWKDGSNASLRDPWGNYYQVVIDTNYDNEIRVPSDTGGGEQIAYTQVAVYSFGPNGKIGGDGAARNDDVVAQ